MPKSHEAGTPKRSVVVINHDLGWIRSSDTATMN